MFAHWIMISPLAPKKLKRILEPFRLISTLFDVCRMTGVNCSYTKADGVYTEQLCSTAQTYCCTSDGSQFCSASECTTSDGMLQNYSAIVFWSILGGLLIVGAVTVLIVYAICYWRKPNNFSRPVSELLKETAQQEGQPETSSRGFPANDSLKNTAKQESQIAPQNSRGAVTICVSSGNVGETPSEHFESSSDVRRLVPSGRGKKEQCSISPRSIRTDLPNIG